MGEFEYIDWLRRRTPRDDRVIVGPGDDCALINSQAGSGWLVTTDMLLDGTHFVLAEAGPRRVGRKAMAVNLSDIAAMAGRPVAAVVSVGLPRQCQEGLGAELYSGLREMADQFQTAIVGGDTNSWEGALAISVTLFGEPAPPGPVLRRGALAGDWLMVTGALGGSILGRHLDFVPRVAEARRLHALVRLHAMIDLSDGLAADARHLAHESGCGVVLHAPMIPIHADVGRRDDGRTPLEHALSDGEDFELAFAVSPSEGEMLVRTQPILDLPLSHVGEFVAEQGLWITDGTHRRSLAASGYEHSFGGPAKKTLL